MSAAGAARWLASWLAWSAPGGSVTGVEPNPTRRAIADDRAKETGSTASFIDGFADALPFDDNSVDLIWCERCCNTWTTRRPRSTTSPGCCEPAVEPYCWIPTTPAG